MHPQGIVHRELDGRRGPGTVHSYYTPLEEPVWVGIDKRDVPPAKIAQLPFRGWEQVYLPLLNERTERRRGKRCEENDWQACHRVV